MVTIVSSFVDLLPKSWTHVAEIICQQMGSPNCPRKYFDIWCCSTYCCHRCEVVGKIDADVVAAAADVVVVVVVAVAVVVVVAVAAVVNVDLLAQFQIMALLLILKATYAVVRVDAFGDNF
jgi:hypothetical protein